MGSGNGKHKFLTAKDLDSSIYKEIKRKYVNIAMAGLLDWIKKVWFSSKGYNECDTE